ncbi:MAG: hypothetical protein AAFY63_06875 [Cyanobacteria bacterium J06643_13]
MGAKLVLYLVQFVENLPILAMAIARRHQNCDTILLGNPLDKSAVRMRIA